MISRKTITALSAAFASVLLLMTLSGCGRHQAAAVPTDPVLNADPVSQSESAEASEGTIYTGRQNGERFETVILLEGMEETVRYEHVRNETVGFEMDYDYESFVRRSETGRECFVSVWDDSYNPENYLEVTYSSQDASSVAASVSEALSRDYEISRDDSFPLDRAGSCIRIDASAVKGGGWMPNQLQMVYIYSALFHRGRRGLWAPLPLSHGHLLGHCRTGRKKTHGRAGRFRDPTVLLYPRSGPGEHRKRRTIPGLLGPLVERRESDRGCVPFLHRVGQPILH